MKAKKIYAIAKNTNTLNVWTAEDGRQFFNFGNALYLIDGMPQMENKEFLAYLDVPKAKRDEWDVAMNPADESLVSDVSNNDRELKPDAVSILVGGRHMVAFHADGGGVLWLDNDKLSPIAAAEWRFFLRAGESGETYIAVFEGAVSCGTADIRADTGGHAGRGACGQADAVGGRKNTSYKRVKRHIKKERLQCRSEARMNY